MGARAGRYLQCLSTAPTGPSPGPPPLFARLFPGLGFYTRFAWLRVQRVEQRPPRALRRRGLEPQQPGGPARARGRRRADRDHGHRALQPARGAVRLHREPHEHARGLRAADDHPAAQARRLRRQEVPGGVPDLRAPDALPRPDRGRPHQSARGFEGGARGRRWSGCSPGSRSSSSPRRRGRRCSTRPLSTRSASSWRSGRRSRSSRWRSRPTPGATARASRISGGSTRPRRCTSRSGSRCGFRAAARPSTSRSSSSSGSTSCRGAGRWRRARPLPRVMPAIRAAPGRPR